VLVWRGPRGVQCGWSKRFFAEVWNWLHSCVGGPLLAPVVEEEKGEKEDEKNTPADAACKGRDM